MIFNKYLSLILSVCFFALLLLIASSAIMIFVPGGSIPFVGVIIIVVFYFLSKLFYTYLRNDDFYKNNRQYHSDRKDEKYLTKGKNDIHIGYSQYFYVVVFNKSCFDLIFRFFYNKVKLNYNI